MSEIVIDDFGVRRHRKNRIVEEMLKRCHTCELVELRQKGYSAEDIIEVAKLSGMSEQLVVDLSVSLGTRTKAMTMEEWLASNPISGHTRVWVPVVVRGFNEDDKEEFIPFMVDCCRTYDASGDTDHLDVVNDEVDNTTNFDTYESHDKDDGWEDWWESGVDWSKTTTVRLERDEDNEEDDSDDDDSDDEDDDETEPLDPGLYSGTKYERWVYNHTPDDDRKFIPVVLHTRDKNDRYVSNTPYVIHCENDYQWRTMANHLWAVEQAGKDSGIPSSWAFDPTVDSDWQNEWYNLNWNDATIIDFEE